MPPGDPPPAPTAADAQQRAEDAAAQAKARQDLADAAHKADEAAAAAQDRVRAAQDVLAKERRAAANLERAAAAARDAAFPPGDGGIGDDGIHNDASTADDLDVHDYEAATIANLHAQAAGVQNIRALVPVILDPLSSHYNRWRDLVLLTLERYALADHVLSDATFPAVPSWRRMDAVVLSWVLGTLSPELMESARTRNGTARRAWTIIEAQFLGNREARALRLDAEFRVFVQGDLSIDDYCRKMKGMADALGDLGEVIRDRTLVLNVLRGLNEKFAHMKAHFKRSKPFPSFNEVRNDLILEEIDSSAPPPPATALVAAPARPSGGYVPPGSGGSAAPHGGFNRSTPPSGSPSAGSAGGGRRRRRGNNGGGKATAPWPSIYNPWTGQITMWPGPQQRGGQAPRAPAPHAASQQALLAAQAHYAPPPVHAAQLAPGPLLPTPFAPPPQPTAVPAASADHASPWTPWSGSWDQPSLASNFSTMTLNPPGATDWVMDSGASSHMTPDTGSQFPERDRQVQ